jgi:hypothetical protein
VYVVSSDWFRAWKDYVDLGSDSADSINERCEWIAHGDNLPARALPWKKRWPVAPKSLE